MYFHVCIVNEFHSSVQPRPQVQAGTSEFSRFQRVVKMVAFHPFDTAENALENMNAVSEHEMTSDLRVLIQVSR